MNLSRWSLRSPVTASMVLVCVVVLGGLAVPRLPLAFLPDVDFPSLEINVPYPNSLPAQVEEEITRPAEEALATMSRVRRITSHSATDGSTIQMDFDWGQDIGPLRVEAREKLDRIRDQLPKDVDQIVVNGFRSSDIPILECRIAAQADLSRSYELLNRHVADPLRRVPGVAKVELYGVEPPQVRIDFSLDALERHNLDAAAVLARVDASNRNMAAGQLKRGSESWPLRVVNQFATLDEIGALPVDDHGLTLKDIAAISYREPDLEYGRHLDHERAIGLNVYKESGANSVEVARRARAALADVGHDPAMRGIEVLTFTDQGEEITGSIKGLLEAGLIGALLAVLVLLFFLRDVPTTLVVATAIPFSLLGAAAILYFTHRTLNILSMMGLMLAVGMLVDNAVVVLEAIHRHRQSGKSALHSALAGSREVQAAVVCSTLASVIVFLPLVLGGRTEITTWLGEVGRTIIVTLVCSLYLSLTMIPLGMGRLLPAVSRMPQAPWLDRLSLRYERVLGWTLAHRLASTGIAIGVFALSIVAFIPVNKSTFSGSKVEAVRIEYDFADNPDQHVAENYVSRVEEWILPRKAALHVKSTYSFFTHNQAMTRAYLADGFADDRGAESVRKLLRQGLPELPGVRLKVAGPDDDNDASRLNVNVFGDPGPRLDGLADDVRRRLTLVPGVQGVERAADHGDKELDVFVERERASRYGLSTQDVARSVAMFFRGRPMSRFRGPDGEVQMEARLADTDRQSLSRLRALPIAVPASAQGSVPLGSLADFRVAETPTSIERQERRSVASLTADVDSKKSGDVKKAVQRELSAMSFPTGYSWSFGSASQNEDETQKEMLMNLLLALALVYVVMASLFESFLHPFAIMIALPFAFAGVAVMCLVTNTPFDLMAQIGLMILIGIVVNNGIVLIHHVHQLRVKGVERREALLQAGRDRLRPILMTTCTTVLGLLPLAFGRTGVGDALYFPLARTVIGGLLASTALTLVLVPCLYTVLEDSSRTIGRLWRGDARRAGAAVAALLVLCAGLVGMAAPGLAAPRPAPTPAAPAPLPHAGTLAKDPDATHWSMAGIRSVHLHVDVGEVEVVGIDAPEVRGRLETGWDEWSDRDDRDRRPPRIVAERTGDRLDLRVRHGHWVFRRMRHHDDMSVRFEVPRGIDLEVDMGVGELRAEDLVAPAKLTLGVGEMEVRCDGASVGELEGHVWIGEANLDAGGSTHEYSGIAPAPFHWRGAPSGGRLDTRVGIGELAVELTPAGTSYSTLPK